MYVPTLHAVYKPVLVSPYCHLNGMFCSTSDAGGHDLHIDHMVLSGQHCGETVYVDRGYETLSEAPRMGAESIGI